MTKDLIQGLTPEVEIFTNRFTCRRICRMDAKEFGPPPSVSHLRSDWRHIVELGYPPMTPAVKAYVKEVKKYRGALPQVQMKDIFVLREAVLNAILSAKAANQMDRSTAMSNIAFIGNSVIRGLTVLPNHLSDRSRSQRGWVRKTRYSRGTGTTVWWAAPMMNGEK